jgi:anaerobic carbon-monoxide dehydrogenase iron sulfur subunit
MKKVLIVDGDKCTGCQICELICSMARTGEYNPNKSCIRVLKNREMGVYIPVIDVTCRSCEKCADWCFDKALRFVTFEEAFIQRKEATIGCFPAPVVPARNAVRGEQ